MAIKFVKQSLFSLLVLSVALPVTAHTGAIDGASLHHSLLHALTDIGYLLAFVIACILVFQRVLR